MNKISLYRKYRPRSFGNVFGQTMIKELLLASIRSNQIGQAYVFSGPRGIGKTSFAKIFACAINCLNRVNGNDACMMCDNCKTIIEEKAMDVVELDAASYNGVEQIREIILNVNYLPTSLPYKVYIIDEAHMLSNAAWNALLKTIEEPPTYAVFILATTEYQKIPLTIISRCLRLDFKRLNKIELTSMLEYVIKKEQITITSEAIAKIVDLADGAGRDALSLLDQLNVHKSIDLKLINTIFGLIDNQYKINFLSHIANNEFSKLRTFVQQLDLEGVSFHLLIDDLIQMLFDTLTYLQTNSLEYVKKLNDLELKTIIDFDLDYQKMLSLLILARNKIKDSIHPLVEMEILIYQLTNFPNKRNNFNNQINLDQLKIKIDNNSSNIINSNSDCKHEELTINQSKQKLKEKSIDWETLFKTKIRYHQPIKQLINNHIDDQNFNLENKNLKINENNDSFLGGQNNTKLSNDEIIKLAQQAICFTTKQKTLNFHNLYKKIKQEEAFAENKKLVDALSVFNYAIDVAWVSDNCVVMMSEFSSRVEAINQIAFNQDFIESFYKVFDSETFSADKQVIAVDRKTVNEIIAKRAELKNIIINDVNNGYVKKITKKLKDAAKALEELKLTLDQ